MTLLERWGLPRRTLYRVFEYLGPFGAALIIASGTGIAWCLLTTLFIAAYQEWFNPRPWLGRESESLVIATDGTPLIRTTTLRERGAVDVSFRRLNNSELPKKPEPTIRNEVYLRTTNDGSREITYLAGSGRVIRLNDVYSGNWYLIITGPDADRSYFAGYDPKSRRTIGFIGKSGFRSDEPPITDQFSMLPGENRLSRVLYSVSELVPSGENFETLYGHVVIAREGIWQVDFDERTTRILAEFKNLDDAQTLWLDPWERDPAKPRYAAVRADGRISLWNAHAKEIAAWTIPSQLRDESFHFYGRPGEPAIATLRDSDTEEHRTRLVRFAADGAILEDAIVFTETIRTTPGYTVSRIGMVVGAAVPMPATIAWLEGLYIRYWRSHVLWTRSANAAYREYLIAMWPTYGVLLIVGIASAYLVARHRRKYGLPRSWAWMVFAFVFGVPGYGGYLLHRRWPLTETCASCSHVVPIDRTSCSNCERAFPRPVLTGTEVFA